MSTEQDPNYHADFCSCCGHKPCNKKESNMKIQLRFRRVGERKSWIETYTTEFMDQFIPTADEEFSHDQGGVSKWGQKLIEWFNSTRKPGEEERELCGARIIPDDECEYEVVES